MFLQPSVALAGHPSPASARDWQSATTPNNERYPAADGLQFCGRRQTPAVFRHCCAFPRSTPSRGNVVVRCLRPLRGGRVAAAPPVPASRGVRSPVESAPAAPKKKKGAGPSSHLLHGVPNFFVHCTRWSRNERPFGGFPKLYVRGDGRTHAGGRPGRFACVVIQLELAIMCDNSMQLRSACNLKWWQKFLQLS